jgi:type VI secretion system secreted protein Hcp
MPHSDMFLKVTTTKQGVVKGESKDDKHLEEIDVLKWAWGVQAHTDLSSLGPTGKASLGQLEIVKRVDKASTALMNACASNEAVKEAVLTVRKAGTYPLEYVTVKLLSARITGLHVESQDHELVEKLTIAYQRIAFTYTPQRSDGSGDGGMVFDASTVNGQNFA